MPRPGGPPTRGWAGGGRMTSGAWSWSPPTRAPCRARPPGTWSPTCPAPAGRARRTVPTRGQPGRDHPDLRHPPLDRDGLYATGKRAVRPVGGGREHVADLDLVAGDDHAVDEQFGEQPPLLEGCGGEA